jgi:zinc/manganese transport system substrate-binding protein
VVLAAAALGLAGCGGGASAAHGAPGVVSAIGAESQYANVLSQIGGRYVHVTSILNNPNVDPHSFEASTSIAQAISQAGLIVQNGLGYDAFMNDIESASPSSTRTVIVAQHVLGLPDSTSNPHLWYDPATMPAVATVIAADLTSRQPSHAAYFKANLAAFDASMSPWTDAIAAFRTAHRGAPVAVTEPVADYLLAAMGARVRTPFVFQADIMNGVDPAPEDITLEEGLLTRHQVKVFCYNPQVVDSLTASVRSDAKASRVPVVAVYETMPTPGYDYQSWMLAETNAIAAAVAHGTSTERL